MDKHINMLGNPPYTTLTIYLNNSNNGKAFNGVLQYLLITEEHNSELNSKINQNLIT